MMSPSRANAVLRGLLERKVKSVMDAGLGLELGDCVADALEELVDVGERVEELDWVADSVWVEDGDLVGVWERVWDGVSLEVKDDVGVLDGVMVEETVEVTD